MVMIRTLAPVFALALLSVPAAAASFDCAKASTPFEKAICDNPDLSKADDRLAKTFATATGGLSPAALTLARNDQRGWLDFARRACTDDAKPLARGSYDEEGAACLVATFNTRSTALESSRMLGGLRFFVQSRYDVLPDPDEVGNPDSYWKLASHVVNYPQLDGDDALASGFNAVVRAAAAELVPSLGEDGDKTDVDASADSTVTLAIKEVVGANRITLDTSTYWYGHGAAHGNSSVGFLHYYVPEQRALEASDVFTGKTWKKVLTDAAWSQLQEQHGEWLQVDDRSEIVEAVTDPTRWDLSNAYGLVIQFQPYEVAAYAYGAPTITIAWEALEAIKADSQDSVRYGW